jgi:succinate-acetate transporter protein
LQLIIIIIIIIIIINNDSTRSNAGIGNRGTIKSKDRRAAKLYPLETWFVSGISVWIPCVKETMMMMIIIIILNITFK